MIILKIIGVLLFVAFASMCIFTALNQTFNLGSKDKEKWQR